jgi:predicted dehydrogenase
MSGSAKIGRRTFLASTAAATTAPYFIPEGVLAANGRVGANERIRVAHIGFGGRARGLYRELDPLRKTGECVSVAICDVDEKRLEDALKQATPGITPYRDYRYILERKDVDAVVIGTPDHWHGVQFVHAADSGKHIYCEKPAHCTIEEGRAMVAAAKRAGVATQIGSQGRSQPEAYLAHRYIVNNLGKVNKVHCFHYPSPVDSSETPDSDPPPELDWDLWLGPLRWRPYNSKYLHGTFRWMLDSGGGQIRDRGAHVFSCAMWWLGQDGTGPVTIEAKGTPPNKGVWDSAVDMYVTYQFHNPDWTLIWDQSRTSAVKAEERRPEELKDGIGKISRPGYGATYYGENDTFVHWGGDGGTWAERKAREWKPSPGFTDVYKSPGHMQDWFRGIKTGKDTIMNVEAGVGVANLCVLGNLSYLLGRKLQWDQQKQAIVGDDEAARLMSRPQRHPYHL